MVDMRTGLRTLLEGDATLTGILTGGIYDASELDQQGLSLSDVALDSIGRITPTAVIRWGAASLITNSRRNTERQFCMIHFYDHVGYSTINQAMFRVRELLHDARFDADDAWIGNISFVSDSQDLTAAELQGAACRMTQYSILYLRR